MGLSMCLPLSGVTGPETIDYPLVLTSPPPTHLGSSPHMRRIGRRSSAHGQRGVAGRMMRRERQTDRQS